MRERDSHSTPFLSAPAHNPRSEPTTTASIQYSQTTVASSYGSPSIRTSPPTTEVRFHEDAGVRLDGGRNQVVDIPPEYQEYSD
ncbi:hypothetical protein BV22DRAFT_1042227 [Leucogyrophana mollusca]|uniref:Uncharacterized protein n=1 Tax=Leucogyrophana mollusca TaxID=85980 RepID=A0ACB8AXN9_9AGAM|nr:hypothetical protein BV22DRAFT_1042227 [Leucogyrophana mollusca]